MKKVNLLMLLLALGEVTFAQTFEFSAEIRPRFEYRHGFKTLMVDTLDAAAFISQRTRLNFDYNSDKINLFINVQNVRIWGDTPTLNNSDKNGVALQQAWVEVILNKQLALKFGRQEISYDDQRVFGNVDWAQQARSHDALVATFKPNETNTIDMGLAISSENETLFDTNYTQNNYKSFQYVWYHTKLKKLDLSFLILNQGYAFFDDNNKQHVDYNQTFGTHARYISQKLKVDTSFYLQTGQIANRDLNAYNMALNTHYALTNHFNLGLGGELLSGTAMNSSDDKLNSFNPWYGTNHKFNGFMDYFYVGNHINTVGLVDLNATLSYQNHPFSAVLMPHIFYSEATIINAEEDELSKYLGTEIDLVLGYKFSKEVLFQAGYSQMIATESMEILKGGNKDATNNWAWIMISVNPSLFTTTFKKD
jgi:hypothetical protein